VRGVNGRIEKHTTKCILVNEGQLREEEMVAVLRMREPIGSEIPNTLPAGTSSTGSSERPMSMYNCSTYKFTLILVNGTIKASYLSYRNEILVMKGIVPAKYVRFE
jgi:hypothetical protein